MKILNFSKYICGLWILLSISSCQKYLNLAPENNTYDEVFWSDTRNIAKATDGAYSMLRSSLRDNRSFFIFGDLVAGNFEVGSDYWDLEILSKVGGFDFSYAPHLESTLWDWTRFYQLINQCNLIIDKTSLIESSKFSGGETEKNRLIAEAKFLRAYTNFYMQRVWGDILLIKESLKDPQVVPPVARSAEDVTLAFCIEDLKYAIANLGNDGRKTKASKGAAQALLAHIYAWQHDYIKAEPLLTEVINSSYHLESIEDYRKIWEGQSKESIFELNTRYSASGGEHDRRFYNAFLADPIIRNKDITSAWYIDLEFLEGYFDESEARFDSIARVSSKGSRMLLRKYDKVLIPANAPRTYEIDNNLVLIRLADIYLLRAEAFFKNGKESFATNDLNLIRNRAGLDDIHVVGEELFIEIFRERRRELVGEGCTQFDLIRMELFDQLDEYSEFYPEDRIAKKGYYWPLYMRVLLPQNELLTQNPWWKSF